MYFKETSTSSSFPYDFFKRSLVELVPSYSLFCPILPTSPQFNPSCYHCSFLTWYNRIFYLFSLKSTPPLWTLSNFLTYGYSKWNKCIWKFKATAMRENMHELSFWVWVTLLRMMFSSPSIYLQISLFLILNTIPFCWCAKNFLICLAIDRHLGCSLQIYRTFHPNLKNTYSSKF